MLAALAGYDRFRRRGSKPPAEIVVELPALEQIVETCRRTRCGGSYRGTGRLLGRWMTHDRPTWYVELYCPRCRTKETVCSAKIDTLGRALDSSPPDADELIARFVADVNASGWS